MIVLLYMCVVSYRRIEKGGIAPEFTRGLPIPVTNLGEIATTSLLVTPSYLLLPYNISSRLTPENTLLSSHSRTQKLHSSILSSPMSPSIEQPPLGDQTTPPRKRRKTQLACHPCRARKTGCDAQRPYCSSCVTRGWENRCGYPEPASQSSSALYDWFPGRCYGIELTYTCWKNFGESWKTPSTTRAEFKGQWVG